jgi:hypothetical protein
MATNYEIMKKWKTKIIVENNEIDSWNKMLNDARADAVMTLFDKDNPIMKAHEQKIRADERAKVMKEVEYLKRYDFEVAKQIFDELDKIKLDGYNCDLWLVKDYQNIKKRFLGDWLVKDYQNIKKKYLGDN